MHEYANLGCTAGWGSPLSYPSRDDGPCATTQQHQGALAALLRAALRAALRAVVAPARAPRYPGSAAVHGGLDQFGVNGTGPRTPPSLPAPFSKWGGMAAALLLAAQLLLFARLAAPCSPPGVVSCETQPGCEPPKLKAKTVADPIGNEEQLMSAARKGALVDLRCGPHEAVQIRKGGSLRPMRSHDGQTNQERAFGDTGNFVTAPDGSPIPGNSGEAWPEERSRGSVW